MIVNRAELEEKYFLLDFDHTFLAASLKEEALLFGITSQSQLLEPVVEYFRTFKPDFLASYPIDKLSGGENAILAVIFYASLAVHKNKSIHFLLHNIMESLSLTNRKHLNRLLSEFHQQGLKFSTLKNDLPVALYE